MKPIPCLEGMWQVAAAHWQNSYLQNILFFFPPWWGKTLQFLIAILEFVSKGAQRGWKRWNFPIHGTKWNGATNESCRPSKVKEEENKIKESHYWNFERAFEQHKQIHTLTQQCSPKLWLRDPFRHERMLAESVLCCSGKIAKFWGSLGRGCRADAATEHQVITVKSNFPIVTRSTVEKCCEKRFSLWIAPGSGKGIGVLRADCVFWFNYFNLWEEIWRRL